jgi:uncharacterized protein (DUF697 family)
MGMRLGLIKNIKSAVSNLNPDKVRINATRPVYLGLVAESEEVYVAMEDAFVPWNSAERANGLRQIVRANQEKAGVVPDVLVYGQGVLTPDGAYTFYPGNLKATIEAILDGRPDLELPLARTFPVFRSFVIERIIKRNSRENAFFSIVTALPDIIPSLIELPWAVGEFASDTAFLTVNQVRMAFEIAAAFGKEVGYQHQKAEIAGILASAFGWRALARQVVGKVPFGGGLVLKGGIAYAGTYVVGRGVERLLQLGTKYTEQERKDLFDKAYEIGRSVSQSVAASLRARKAEKTTGKGTDYA